jgi:hypothetical protein
VSQTVNIAGRVRHDLIAVASMTLMLIACPPAAEGQDQPRPVPDVRAVSEAEGQKLQVDGVDFMIFGMNWGHMPIGQNYLYSLWKQPDEIIEAALAREMPMLQDMGVNAIRHYVGIPPRWVQYIYERYGIYTMVNHPVGRYGFTVDGAWIPSIDYSDERTREVIKADVLAMVREFHGVPGMLMWLLGNENNYGLSWSSFEIEALPEGEREAARARYLYSLFEEITQAIKEEDPGRLVAIANGDVQYIDIIAQECGSLDVFGTNVYRGISARDLFQVVKDKLGVPQMFTEFGADAWNAREMREDQVMQARYLIGQWQEIYEQSSGKGRVGNAVGGFTFQWSDGWWKFGQESRLDIHDTNASWPNGGYIEDFVEGENNMNEEWWGITAKGAPDYRGLYDVYPRAAYYALRRAYELDPYAPETDLEKIRTHFGAINPATVALEARGDRATLQSESTSKVRVSGLRLEFETYSTGGRRTSTPEDTDPAEQIPAFKGFDKMQSFYADFEARPTENVIGTLSLNVLGEVPANPIDEIFYENRGRPLTVVTDTTNVPELTELEGTERVKVYQATVSWDDKWFQLDGFYRTGHLHWQYEGDFFGLYRDAYYGENIDIYNSVTPVGIEIGFKRQLEGLKLAFGPQLWWGANPAVFVKYNRRLGPFDATGIFHEDVAPQTEVTSTVAFPLVETRKFAFSVKASKGHMGLELGGMWSGSTKIGEKFDIIDEEEVEREDEVEVADTFGAKAKITYEKGLWHWYAQGAIMGLVADGGPTSIPTFTGWHLKDSGSGNQSNFITGLAVNSGDFQISPNFLYQKPMAGPIPDELGRPRNVEVNPVSGERPDPFAVRANRETVAGELMLTYDPTPATWMWAWDNDVREDARFAASVGYVFRHLPTTMDAATGILEDGRTSFSFDGATPPRDLWEINARIVSRLRANVRIVAHIFGGTGEPRGNDPRKITRYGGDARMAWGSLALAGYAKFNDWGPYDYHRDGNNTFPVQLMGDLSHTLGAPKWFDYPQTRLGVRATYRSLDQYSPRYCPGKTSSCEGVLECDPELPGPDGYEWEIRTYLHFAI